VLLGIISPVLFLSIYPAYDAKAIGLWYNADTIYKTALWIVGLGIPIVAVMRFVSRAKVISAAYPQIRVREWDAMLLGRYSLAWALFMLGYEILFRGLLLFPLADRLGVWPAVAVNTIFYAGSHIPKGHSETFAAMLFGPLLCIITLQTETVWAAASLHIILAVSNSILAVKFNPEFVMVKSRRHIYNSQCEMGCRCHPIEM
jgi:membrane protease YdiL (CAAX protease family)